MDINRTQIDLLENRRFVAIQTPSNYEVSFDLNEKEFFSQDYAVKDSVAYGQNQWSASEFYSSWSRKNITPIFYKLKVTKKEIKNKNYILELDSENLLDENKIDDPKSGDIESYYVYSKMTKVRISYNKDFLPVKLEGYYEKEGKISWNLLRTYSYPYRSKAEFDKALDKQIANIKEREAEEREE